MTVKRRTCTWCGHNPHDGFCPRAITIDPRAPANSYPCPCAWRIGTQPPQQQEDNPK